MHSLFFGEARLLKKEQSFSSPRSLVCVSELILDTRGNITTRPARHRCTITLSCVFSGSVLVSSRLVMNVIMRDFITDISNLCRAHWLSLSLRCNQQICQPPVLLRECFVLF